jgi:hypothetical protein
MSAQLVQHIGTQLIAHPIHIPDGRGERPLHAVGRVFSSLFGQLPAIFARRFTQEALQIGQDTTTGLWAGEMRSNASMQARQFVRPLHHLSHRRLDGLWYGKGVRLHSLLLVP